MDDEFIADLTKALLLPQCRVLKLDREEGQEQLFNLYDEVGNTLLESKNFTETTNHILYVLWKPPERNSNGKT